MCVGYLALLMRGQWTVPSYPRVVLDASFHLSHENSFVAREWLKYVHLVH